MKRIAKKNKSLYLSVSRATSQSIGAAASTKLQFNTVALDPAGGFVAATNRYVIPKPGIWYIAGRTLGTATVQGGNWRADLMIDGGAVEYSVNDKAGTASVNPSINYSFLRSLNAGQYVEINHYHTLDNPLNILGDDSLPGSTVLMIYKID